MHMKDVTPMDQPSFGNLTGDPSVIKESSAAEFAEDVIATSRDTPVIVDFWAEWCGPCKQLGPIIEKIVLEKGGSVKLVKIDIEKSPEIAQQMQVQSIPAVFAFVNGQPVDGFVGAQPESQIRSFIDRAIQRTGGTAEPSPLEQALGHAAELFAGGDTQNSGALYDQILQQQPDNTAAVAGLAKCLLAEGQVDAVKKLLADVPEDKQGDADISSVRASLELAGAGAEAANQSETLKIEVTENPGNHQARFDLALALFAQGDKESAISHLLYIIKRDRSWNEDSARKQLLKMFDALGNDDPATLDGRQQLSLILFS